VFETDYFTSYSAQNSEYGYMLFGLPTNDADTNGLPDFLQAETAVNATFGNPASAGRMDYPGTSSFSIAGQFRRNAGDLRGTYDLTITAGGSVITYNAAVWSLLRVAGALDYSREESNSIQLSLTLTNGNGTSAMLTGSAIYSVPDANHLVLPQLVLRRNQNQRIILAPMTLIRSGHRYLGNAVAADGNFAHRGRSTRFVVEIVDDNDSNTMHSDLTDLTEAPDSILPHVVHLAYPNARANDILTVRGTASGQHRRRPRRYAVGTSAFQTATGTNNWSAAVPLEWGRTSSRRGL
jgi:hypothetical protein